VKKAQMIYQVFFGGIESAGPTLYTRESAWAILYRCYTSRVRLHLSWSWSPECSRRANWCLPAMARRRARNPRALCIPPTSLVSEDPTWRSTHSCAHLWSKCYRRTL